MFLASSKIPQPLKMDHFTSMFLVKIMIYMRTEPIPIFEKGTIMDFETIGSFDKRFHDHGEVPMKRPSLLKTLFNSPRELEQAYLVLLKVAEN